MQSCMFYILCILTVLSSLCDQLLSDNGTFRALLTVVTFRADVNIIHKI